MMADGGADLARLCAAFGAVPAEAAFAEMLEQGPADVGGAAGAAPHTRPPGGPRPAFGPPAARPRRPASAPLRGGPLGGVHTIPPRVMARAARAGRASGAQDAAAAALQRFCRGALHECITQARRQRACTLSWHRVCAHSNTALL